ncbi:zinc-binding dehydrogenase [Conexibacter sp. CPCC 206217]|uniref:quinone oxidoreductase family protein n=1 Tax=Conexibacter sp. CPCC 206217 TaxID=3064574 RepID=UPI002716109C|nr:zinc-binding dehydrogenase [Conexibacter sp. CPCC 206217]MDO8212444.1 zinc-binding dehydrogenase [Conexibacter sp. CPCC 206217]
MEIETRRQIVLDRFGPPEVMRWDDGPVPPRGPDDVLVAVEAIGVNFGDTMVRRGEYRREQPLTFTPGFEVAGRVVEAPAGEDSRGAAGGDPAHGRQPLAPGTRVVAFTEHGGGYADAVVVPRDHVYTVADGVDDVTAAGIFTQGVTAWYAVHRYGRLAAGETVLVHAAAGGLGGLAVQLAAEHGATTIATASTEQKLAIAREHHGAAHTLISDPDTLAQQVRGLTHGRGADAVIDGVGGPLFTPSLRALAFNGRYVVAGSASQAPATLDVRALMPRGQTIAGFVVARVAEQDPAEPQRAFDAIQERVRAGRLRPQITVLPPEQIAHAHELIESRRLTGKVVVRLV